MSEELDPKRGLVVKLCEVMAAVGYMQKRGENSASTQGYKYVTEADVAQAVRGEFAKRNIFVFPSLISQERHKLSVMKYDKLNESYITDIVMRWTIVDGDTGQERSCDIPGSSASPGDKQVYVAMTGSEKYLLMKSLFLPTGDDPENNENEPLGSKEAQDAVAQRKIDGAGKTQTPINKPPVPPPAPAKATPQEAEDFVTLDGTLLGIEQKVTTKEKGSKPFYKVFMAVNERGEIMDKEAVAWENFALPEGTSLFKELGIMPSEAALSFVCKTSEYRGKTQYSIKSVNRIGSKVFGDSGQA